MVAHDPAVLAEITGQCGGGGRPGIPQASEDPLAHRMREGLEFFNLPQFTGLHVVAHDARITLHAIPCKYFCALLLDPVSTS